MPEEYEVTLPEGGTYRVSSPTPLSVDDVEAKAREAAFGSLPAKSWFQRNAVLGTKTGAYKWGGKPGSPQGTDCSGAMCDIFEKFTGVKLPRTAKEQLNDKRAQPVDPRQLQEGDLVFFGSPGPSGHHVGVYSGNGKVAHQSSDKKPDLTETDLASLIKSLGFKGARRYANVPPATVPPTRTLQDVVDRPKTVAKALETRKAKEGERNVAIQSAIINTMNQDEMATRPAVGREGAPLESEINPAGSRLVPSDQTSPRKVLEQSLGDPYRTVSEKVGKPLQRAIGKHIRNLTFGLSPLQKAIETTNPTMTEEEVDEAVGTWLGIPENVDQAAIQGALAVGGPAAVKAFGFLMRKAGPKVAEAFGPQVAKAVDEIPLSNADEAMFGIVPKVEPPTGLPGTVRPQKPPAAPKSQPTPSGVADKAKRKVAVPKVEEGTKPIRVYRGSNLSEDPKAANLTGTRSIHEVLGKEKPAGPEPLNVTWYTETPKHARSYAQQDLDLLQMLKRSRGPGDPPAERSFKVLTGRDAPGPTAVGKMEAFDVNPNKVLDLSELGPQADPDAMIFKLMEAEGSPIPGKDSGPEAWARYHEIWEKYVAFADDGDAGPVTPYRLLRNDEPGIHGPGDSHNHGTQFVEWAKANGYDAIRLREGDGTHVVILDPDNARISPAQQLRQAGTPEPPKPTVKPTPTKGAKEPLESVGGPPREIPLSKPTGGVGKDPNITEAGAGFNPIDIIKKADDLNTPNFTLQRRPKDWSTAENLRSPLDIVDGEGQVLQTGSYSRLAGEKGAAASKAIRDTEQRITQASQGYNRGIDVIKDVLDNVRGAGTAKKLAEVLPGKARRTRDEFYESFVDLVERDLDDPVRTSATGPLKEALDMHDALTEKWRQSIIDNRRALGETMPDDWGVTEKGYFRHLFLGDFVLKDGADIIGTARTYAEAQKKALDYVAKNPQAHITAQARDMSFGDPTVRVTNRKYWKTVGELSDSVGLSMDEIMEDIRGVVGRKGGRQKFLGALLKRKGTAGYSKSYEEVMRIHAAQLVRSQELSRLNKELAPIIEDVGKELPGVANAMQTHLDTLWGIPTAGEKAFGEMVMRIPVIRNFVGSPAMAARGTARRLANFQSVMKLHLGVRAPIINALQPFSTLWPYIKTKDFAVIYGDYLKPATRQMLREKGVLSSATKLESGGIIAGKKLKSPFNAASDLNRGVGYLFGYRGALKKGLSEEAAHKSGLAWAEKVEFDNSLWNAPPTIRGPGGRVFGQFKGFTVKNLEHLQNLGAKKPGDTRLTRAGRVLKAVGALSAQGGTSALTLGVKLAGASTIVNAVREGLVAEGMDPKMADKFAHVAAYGVPSLIGADISGSVTVLDEPFGDSWQEKLVNFAAGPTVTTFGRGIQELFSDKPLNEKVGRVGKAITPAAKQADAIQQFIQSGPKGVNVRVGAKEWVTLSPQEAVLMMLGFQPLSVSKHYDDKEIKGKKEPKLKMGIPDASGSVGIPAGNPAIGLP